MKQQTKNAVVIGTWKLLTMCMEHNERARYKEHIVIHHQVTWISIIHLERTKGYISSLKLNFFLLSLSLSFHGIIRNTKCIKFNVISPKQTCSLIMILRQFGISLYSHVIHIYTRRPPKKIACCAAATSSSSQYKDRYREKMVCYLYGVIF